MAGIESASSLSLKTARSVASVGAIVLTLAVLLLGGAWWVPLEVNRLAREEEGRQIASNLRQRLERFAQDHRGSAIWDDAVRSIRLAYDEEWVANNYGA